LQIADTKKSQRCRWLFQCRLTYTGENHPVISAAMFVAIVDGYPALRLLPADIIYVGAKRK
jgi:hypothetical protein